MVDSNRTVQDHIVPSKAVILYGPAIVPWTTFADAEIVKMELGSPIQPEKRSPAFLSLDLQIFQVWCRSKDIKKMGIAFLLSQFRERGATDCRDRVYWILGLLIEWPHPGPFFTRLYHFFD